MNRLISIWLCFVLVGSSCFVLVDVRVDPGMNNITGSGSDFVISTPYTDAPMHSEAPSSVDDERTASQASQLMGGVFTENRGQLNNNEVSYYLGSGSGGIAFSPGSVMLTTIEAENNVAVERPRDPRTPHDMELPRETISRKGNAIKLNFVGCNDVQPVGRDPSPWCNNYFIGNNTSQWQTNVPNYREIVYENLWDGIDLVYYTKEGNLKYDFIVHPFADYTKIIINVQGHRALSVTRDGSLKMTTELGPDNDILDTGLEVFYADDIRQKIPAQFSLNGDTYAFQLDERDPSCPLIIDPIYSTFLGGSNEDRGMDIAVDSDGSAYVTGYAYSTNFPTSVGAFKVTSAGNQDAFVTKLSQSGDSLLYSSFLGGSNDDCCYDIAVDSDGFAYVAGYTYSTDFSTSIGAFDTVHNDNFDVFVTKLNQSGDSLVYSSFLGGNNKDRGTSIAVDSSGFAYVTGFTESANFPTTAGAFDTIFNGFDNVFVTKFSLSGDSLMYSTFLPGADDYGWGIAVDTDDFAYVTGYRNHPFGYSDMFVTKLSQSGGSLVYSTFLGGSGNDYGWGIAVDNGGFAYVTGYTCSTDFPTTVGAFDTTYGGTQDAFVMKLSQSGGSLVYSTFLGGSGYNSGSGVVVNTDGFAHVTGSTHSTSFPTTAGAFDTTFGGFVDAFVSTISQSGDSLAYSTYLGDSNIDNGNGIALDSSGFAYVTGSTCSTGFPTTAGAFDTVHNINYDVFVTKFDIRPPIANAGLDQIVDEDTLVIFNGSNSTDNVGIDNYTWAFDDGGPLDIYGVSPNHTFNAPGLYNVTLTVRNIKGNIDIDRMTVTVLDITSPIISNITHSPNIQEAGEVVNINADVMDNLAVDEVWLNLTRPDNSWVNQTMTAGTALAYYLNISYSLLGLYNYSIWASDTSGNWNFSVNISYNFTINDTTSPLITLNSPANNSIISPGTIIDLDITDLTLDITNYSLNGAVNTSLPNPYDINTAGWPEGDNFIIVHAEDLAGNKNTTIYNFTIDSLPPVITLNSPTNNSIFQAGEVIDLTVTDIHLDTVNYTRNNGSYQALPAPYNISTAGWPSGWYDIEVNALDTAGNIAVELYNFTVDSSRPVITLVSPADNDIVQAGTILDFDIIDPRLNIVNYSVEDGSAVDFTAPYDIDTTGWLDGSYNITIQANDTLGNAAESDYSFVIDSTNPDIVMDSPGNNSFVQPGTVLSFDIIDANMDFANYSVDGNAVINFTSNYEIDTAGWNDSTYSILINAIDEAGNSGSGIFTITIDGTPPVVLSTVPIDYAVGIAPGSQVIIQFSELMNQTSVQNSISITPSTPNFTHSWQESNLTLIFASNLTGNTTYSVNIGTSAADLAGNSLQAYSFGFATWLDTDDDGIPDSDDPDDDNDGFLDEWELFLGTDPDDPNDTPSDTDDDGIPNGDANNTESWMDDDDDDDGVPDDIDLDPTDPSVGEVVDDMVISASNYYNWGWIIFIVTMLAILVLAVNEIKSQK